MESHSKQGLHGLIERSLRYPSPDNSQPFLFKILSASTFEIYVDTDKSTHRFNFGNLATWITLGGLFENLNLEAKRDGYQCEFDLTKLETSKKIQKLANVKVTKEDVSISEEDQYLIENLDKRCVDRRAYKSEPLPEHHINWLTKQISLDRSLVFSYLRKLPTVLVDRFLLIEELTWQDRKAVADILKWTRFTHKEEVATRDGLNWNSLDIPVIFKPFFKLFQSHPDFYQVLARNGSTKSNRKRLETQIKNSSGFGFIGLSSHEPHNIVNLGRSYFRMWAYLNSHGYGFQPLTFATLAPYVDYLGNLPTDWPEELHEAYLKTRGLLQSETMMTESFVPVWGFRTGRANPLPAKARSLRKKIEDVLIT